MADKKLTDLPAAGALTGAELYYAVQSGIDVKVLGSLLSALTPPGGSSGQVQYNNGGVFGGLTVAQLTALINLFSSSLSGAVPASGGGTTNFLRADGSWAAPPGGGGGSPGGLNGQIQYNNAGSFGGLTNTQVTAAINLFTNLLSGAVPASGGGTTKFLRADGSWQVPPTNPGTFTPSVQTPAPVGCPGGNVETTLITFTLPANTLTVVGQGLRVRAAGYWNNTSIPATINLYIGSEFITVINQATDGSRWQAEMEAILVSLGPTKQYVTGSALMNTVVSPFGSNPTIDFTSPVVCKVTGKSGTASAAVAYQLICEPSTSG